MYCSVSRVSLEQLPFEVFKNYLCRHLIKSSIVDSLKDKKTQAEENRIIENFHFNHKNFFPVDIFISQDAKKIAESQNGVKINFEQKKICFYSFYSLLSVSHHVQNFYEKALKCNYQYWFKKRAILNMFSECYFQRNIKLREQEHSFLLINDIVQTPYLKMYKKNIETINFNYSSCFYWSKYFFTMPDFFIAFSARTLLSLYSLNEEQKNPSDALRHTIFFAFFNERDYGPSLNNDLNKTLIFLIALSLGLLMPNSPKKDLQAIYQDFIGLKDLFGILSDDKACIKEKATLDSLDDFYVKQFNILDRKNSCINFKDSFNKKEYCDPALLLQSIENMAHYFFGFETLLTKYDQEYYKNFSDEKKLFFIYCMLKSNPDSYRAPVCIKSLSS